jgi:hypothetical protein
VRLVERRLRLLGQPLLVLVGVEDDRSILRAMIAELARAVGRIDVVPVRVEQRRR